MWSPNTRSSQLNKRQAWRNTRVWLLGALFVLATTAILIVPLSAVGQVALNAGEVAPEDVRSPRTDRYVSEVLTELARDEAERSVAVQYDPVDPRVARQQIAYARQVLDFIRAVRLDTQATRDQKRSNLAVIENVSLSATVIDALLELPADTWQRVSQEVIAVIDLTMRSEIRDVNVIEIKGRLPALVAIDLNEDQTRLVSEVAQNFIVPNRARNDAATEQARAEARSKVEPRSRDIETGQTIIRQGEVVTPLQIEALNQLNLRQSQLGWGDLGGALLIALAAAALMGLYLWRFEAELLDRPRHLLLLLLLLVLFLLVAKFMVPNRTVLPYVFPAAALSMLLTVLLGPGLAVTTSIMLAGLIGVLANGSLEITMYVAAGGLIAVLSLGRVERLNTFFFAGLNVALINAVILLAVVLMIIWGLTRVVDIRKEL